jgi:hypothetical protein
MRSIVMPCSANQATARFRNATQLTLSSTPANSL